MHDNTKPSKALDADDQYNEEDDSVNNYAHDDYEGRDDVDGHDGEYDEITFNWEDCKWIAWLKLQLLKLNSLQR